MFKLNQLTGFGVKPELTGLSYVGSTATEYYSGLGTPLFPTGLTAGDLIICCNWATNSTLPTTKVPTGFTQVYNSNDTYSRAIVSYKVSDGTESGTALANFMTTIIGWSDIFLIAFKPASPATFSFQDVTYETTNNDPASQTINCGSSSNPRCVIGWFDCDDTDPTVTMSPTQDGTCLMGSTGIYWKIYNLPSGNVTFDAPDGGSSNHLGSFYVEAT